MRWPQPEDGCLGAGAVAMRPAWLCQARPGTDPAISRLVPEGPMSPPSNAGRTRSVEATNRNPLFLFRLFGLFLLR
jgi:hypothetical protein